MKNSKNFVECLAAILLLSLFLVPFASANWAMYRSNLSRNGVGDGDSVLTPTLIWKTNISLPTVEAGIQNKVQHQSITWSTPVIVNGIVYASSTSLVSSYSGLLVSSSYSINFQWSDVYAIDSKTGAVLWTARNITSGQLSDLSVDSGVLYFGSDDNTVYALSARNGAFLWKSPIPNIGNSSPAVANGVVYIGGYGGIVYALNAGSGAIIRSKTAGVNVASSSPAVVDGVVYLGSNDNYFYALDAKTGDILWRSNTNGWVSYSPAVYNGVVYASSLDGNVYALDAKTGNKIWNYDTTPSEYSWQLHTAPALPLSPAVVDGVVYFPVDFIPFVQGTTNPGGTFQVAGNGWTQIYALNAANGDKIWNATIGTSGQGGIPPVLSGGYLYTRSGGNILALNSGNGNLAWNFSLNSDSELIVDNGALYLSSEDGQIYALGQESNIPQPSSNIYFGEEMGIALVVFVAITISLIIILRRKRFLQNIPK